MAIYSITDLEKLTGIKAHTIRIWEKRYHIIAPKRTKTNIRYYNEDDLKRVSNIAVLNQKGYRISQICEMPLNEVEDLVANLSDIETFSIESLDALTLSIIHLDEIKFKHLVNKNIDQHGFEYAFDQILMPLLDKMHDLWLSGSIKKVHEEFLNVLIQRKLSNQISKLDSESNTLDIRFIIFLPPGESQELSSLYVEYYLRKNGIRLINLEDELNVRELLDAVQIYKPQFLASFINEETSKTFLNELINGFKDWEKYPTLLISGYYSDAFPQHEKYIRKIHNFEELNQFITTIIKIHLINVK
ncbi:MAG: MerR family transcriptional regulator [Bacteroidota bacterium]|nr:MerR family transcriptional regulator [Bacteroidota bacterium]